MVAAIQGRNEIIDLLLKNGADPSIKDKDGKTALTLAEEAVHVDAAKTLKADLMDAGYHGYDKVAELAIAGGVDVNKKNQYGDTALIFASQEDNIGVVKKLIAAKADVNSASNINRTALMVAAIKGRTEIIKLLLKSGANPSMKDKDGKTALMHAEENKQAEAAKLLK
jgi:ankyrin repeat protein